MYNPVCGNIGGVTSERNLLVTCVWGYLVYALLKGVMMLEMKIAALPIRELQEKMPVELWYNGRGRLVIRAYGESGYVLTDLDLYDVLKWASDQLGERHGSKKLCGRTRGGDSKGS